MKKLSLLVILISITSLQAAPFGYFGANDTEPAVENEREAGILGNWKMAMEPEMDIAGDKVKFTIVLGFEPKSLTTTNTCSYASGTKLEAKVSAPIEIDENAHTVRILADGHNKVSKDGKDCEVAVTQNTVDYEIKNGQLVLKGNGQEVILNRQ